MPELEPARPGEVNYPIFDRFTLAHLAVGATYGFLALSFLAAALLAVAWEFVENPLKANFPRIFPHASRDTLRNAVGDIVAVLTGWAVVTYLS